MSDRSLQACRAAAKIDVTAIAADLALIRLPRCWWAYREARTRFRRARLGSELYTLTLAGKTALGRLSKWSAEAEPRVAAEFRQREQRRRDAEWEDAAL